MPKPAKRPGPAPRPAAENVSENVSARIMPAERDALTQLIRRRAADMEARGETPDLSFAGWLRAKIRTDAKDAGIEIASAVPPVEPARKPARKAARS